jgi:hypothetical protein
MAKLLLKGEKDSDDKESKVGLLIDWLQMLDPELVQASSDIRLSLLFSQIDKQSAAGAVSKHSRYKNKIQHVILTLQTKTNVMDQT